MGSSLYHTGMGNHISLESVARLSGMGIDHIRRVSWALDHAVTDNGRVFSARPCRWRRDEPLREMKLGIHQFGYKYIRIYTSSGICRSITVHRLVAETFIGSAPKGKSYVLHWDRNPSNNNVCNLRYGSQKDNMEDCVRHGNSRSGEKNWNAKLNQEKANLIRALVSSGKNKRAVAKFMGVSTTTVERIVSRSKIGGWDDKR